MRTDKEGRAFAFHGSLLGAGALLGTLWGAIKFSGIDWATGSATHALLFNEAFAVALAACGVCWCAALAVRKPKAEGRAGLPLAACCAGTALVLLGSFVMGWCFLGAGVPLVAIVLAGACFGMGMLMLGFGWLAAYAAFEPATALVHAGLSFVLAGGLRYAFVTLDSAVASVAGVLALAVAAACALPLAQRAAAGQPVVTTEDDGEPCTWRQQVAQAFEMLWLPLVGAMIASFIQGLVWDPVASQTSVIDAWSVRSLSVVAGPAVGAVVIFLILGASKGAKGLRTLQQVAYPIAMAILLLYPVVGPAEGVLADVLELVPQACFALVALFLWSAAAIAARGLRLLPSLVLAACAAGLALAYLAGLLLIKVVGTGGRDLCLVMLTAYLVLFSISLAQNTQTEKHGRVTDELRPEVLIRQRCDELSGAYGVSPRETEVLYYLGRGYNHGYIARKLFVSENTVRTHVRHIYAKLGVSSREELLDLIDDPGTALGASADGL